MAHFRSNWISMEPNPVYRIPVPVKRKLRLEKAGGMGQLPSRTFLFSFSSHLPIVAK
jgi:hypothetical protein